MDDTMSLHEGSNRGLFEYEGIRQRVSIDGDLDSLTTEIKRTFSIREDVELVAELDDGTEETIRDEDGVSKIRTAAKVAVYRGSGDMLAIGIGDEEYSLGSIPPSQSNLVTVAIHEVIFGEFNVKKFVDSLRDFVGEVRHAHIRLLAVDQRKLAVKLHKLGSDILQPLILKCVATLNTIVRKSSNILSTLVNVYEYLRDGHENEASIILKSLCEMANEMEKESADRVVELATAMNKCGEVRDKTSKKWVMRGNKDEKIDDKLKRNEEKLTAEREKMMNGSHFLQRVYWKMWEGLGSEYGSNEFLDKKKALEEERNVIQAAKKDQEGVAEHLRIALVAIKNSHAVMRDMSTFWSGTQTAISELANNDAFLQIIDEAAKGARQKIQKLMRSTAFRRQGITFMARYVAIHDVSAVCSERMKEVKENMSLFLTETPSKEQAMEMLKDGSIQMPQREDTSAAMEEERHSSLFPSAPSVHAYEEIRENIQSIEEIRSMFHTPPQEQLSMPVQATD